VPVDSAYSYSALGIVHSYSALGIPTAYLRTGGYISENEGLPCHSAGRPLVLLRRRWTCAGSTSVKGVLVM